MNYYSIDGIIGVEKWFIWHYDIVKNSYSWFYLFPFMSPRDMMREKWFSRRNLLCLFKYLHKFFHQAIVVWFRYEDVDVSSVDFTSREWINKGPTEVCDRWRRIFGFIWKKSIHLVLGNTLILVQIFHQSCKEVDLWGFCISPCAHRGDNILIEGVELLGERWGKNADEVALIQDLLHH